VLVHIQPRPDNQHGDDEKSVSSTVEDPESTSTYLTAINKVRNRKEDQHTVGSQPEAVR
jgi:hypothetical protein